MKTTQAQKLAKILEYGNIRPLTELELKSMKYHFPKYKGNKGYQFITNNPHGNPEKIKMLTDNPFKLIDSVLKDIIK